MVAQTGQFLDHDMTLAPDSGNFVENVRLSELCFMDILNNTKYLDQQIKDAVAWKRPTMIAGT